MLCKKSDANFFLNTDTRDKSNNTHYTWILKRKFSVSCVLSLSLFLCHDNVVHHKCTYFLLKNTLTTNKYGNLLNWPRLHIGFTTPGLLMHSTSIVLRVYSDLCVCVMCMYMCQSLSLSLTPHCSSEFMYVHDSNYYSKCKY